jgi:putative PIN family toxin of toxin-antitoxin system
MRVVLDTNVLISSLLWKGKLALFFELINEQKIILCFSKSTLNELIRVSHYPHIAKKIKEENINFDKIISKLVSKSILVTPKFVPNIIKDDPSDNKFLACALSAQASFIISGDNHLLKVKKFQKIPIVEPREFLSKMR